VKALAQTLIYSARDRMLWGSDWPHTQNIPGHSPTESTPFSKIDDAGVFRQFRSYTRRADAEDDARRQCGEALSVLTYERGSRPVNGISRRSALELAERGRGGGVSKERIGHGSSANENVRHRHDERAGLSAAIHAKRVSCVEVMNAYLDHIARLNPKVNAIVALQDRAGLLTQARERDAQLARGEYQGWMHGFPHAVKDLQPVKGITMTMGSLLYKGFVPTTDAIFVERIKRAGAIIIGKTNTPEFGLGSNTYNEVYGTTLNAYDQTKTAGGSSGGASVGLALRMLPVADGSDTGGSLRNPAAYNNIYGLRPAYGRVPQDRRRCVQSSSASPARWRATFPTSRCCSRCRRAMTRACRCRTGRTRSNSRKP
jgi:hypothetical protein